MMKRAKGVVRELSIGEPTRYQNIATIMSYEVLTVTPENTLNEAARIMGDKHIGSLIVMKYKTPVGIITEGDLLNVVTEGIPLEKDCMGTPEY